MGWSTSWSSSSYLASSVDNDGGTTNPAAAKKTKGGLTNARKSTGIRPRPPHSGFSSSNNSSQKETVWRLCGYSLTWTRQRLLTTYLVLGLIITSTGGQISLALIVNSKRQPCPTCKAGWFEGQLILNLFEALGMSSLMLIYVADIYVCTQILHLKRGSMEHIGFGPICPEAARSSSAPDAREERSSGLYGNDDEDDEEVPLMHKQPPWYLWILPGIADCAANVLYFYAASIMSLTQVNIMKPFRLFIIVIFSMAYFHREIRIHCIVGIVLFVIAQVFSTVDETVLIKNNQSFIENESDLIKAMSMCVIGVVCQALEILIFEGMAWRYYVHPLRGIGIMGIVGIIATLATMLIGELTHMQDLSRGWYQMRFSNRLIYSTLANSIATSLMNLLSLILTTHITSVFTSTVLALRIIPIYIIEVAMRWLGFSWLGCTAVILCIFGILIYSGIPLHWMNAEGNACRFLRARLHLVCHIRKGYNPQAEESMNGPVKLGGSILAGQGMKIEGDGEMDEDKRLDSRSSITRKFSGVLVNPWIMIEKLSDRLSPRL